MDLELKVVLLHLLSVSAYAAKAFNGESVLDIVAKYGAKPDQDATEALTSAWSDACASKDPSKIVVPSGTYNLSRIGFKGPCKGPIEFEVVGTLQAPSDAMLGEVGWVIFSHVRYVNLSGGGTFDGQGQSAWEKNNCSKTLNCSRPSASLRFEFVDNSQVSGISTLNSKGFHISVLSCNILTFDGINIVAPGNSPNTDGIHISRSTGINVTSSIIGTGDDCISIGDGNKQLTISNVTCGPGHGISVGSLGKYPNEQPVIGVFVTNCTFIGTSHGVRIKSWPNANPGSASDIQFEDIIIENTRNPAIIDQEYCPNSLCSAKCPSNVKISNVSFKSISGNSASQVAVTMNCSSAFPCEDVEVADIDLTYDEGEGPIKSVCQNVKPEVSGTQHPPICPT